MVGLELRRKRGKEKDPVNWLAIDEAIVLKLAEPDPEDPGKRRYPEIDQALAEAIIDGVDKSGLSETHIERMRDGMLKRIIDAKALTLARLNNYRYLTTNVEKARMDAFLSTLRDLNPATSFESMSDYAALFTQEVARPVQQDTQVTYIDPTAPPKFDPNRPIAPGNFLDNILGRDETRFIGDPPKPVGAKVYSSPLPNNHRVMGSKY